jgi:large subunit ribosomal protein L25
MSELILRAVPRTVVGKKVKRLRQEGLIPGVVYGPVVDGTVQVSVEQREFEKFYAANGQSTLFGLSVDGGSHQVFIREVQIDPVRRSPLHIDFFAPNLLKEITASVPVVLHHLQENAEGVLNHVRNEVDVRGLPANLPHQVDADIAHLLAVGDTLRAGDLTFPEGVALVTGADELIASLVPEAVEEVEEVEEEELAEAVEGAEEAAEEAQEAAAEAAEESAES